MATTDPRLRNSQFAYWETLQALVPHVESWLDLGCGHQFVPDWVAPGVSRPATCVAFGVDADFASLRQHAQLDHRVAADIERLPLPDSRFDLVTANMVIEHVRRPAELFAEVRRVLRPGGTFLVHTPNKSGYTTLLARAVPGSLKPAIAHALQGRREEDVYPTHYRANTMTALRTLALTTPFRVREIRTVTSSPQLYRVPVVSSLEQQLLKLIAGRGHERWRPCIIGQFVKC